MCLFFLNRANVSGQQVGCVERFGNVLYIELFFEVSFACSEWPYLKERRLPMCVERLGGGFFFLSIPDEAN